MATAYTYENLMLDVFGAAPINWNSDNIKVALLTSSYTPNQGTDQFWSTVSTYETTGTGYTAGGQALTGKTATLNTTTKVTTFSASNASWTSSTITARYAVIYDATPAATTAQPLIAYVDFGSDQSSSSGTFTVAWSASGIFTTTAS